MSSAHASTSGSDDASRLSGGRVWMAAAGALLAGLCAAPLVFHHYDVVDCFLAWARATEGRRPWEVYSRAFRTPCDYPPVVPYLLTAIEAARRTLGAAEAGPAAVILLKVPNLLAAAAHAPLAWFGLRGLLGPQAALVAGLFGALSPALFVNAALWGQFDALLSLLVLGAALALLHARPAAAGALLGAALATKLLAVVALPVLLPWAVRRLGWRAVFRGAWAAIAVMVVLAAPMVIGGAGDAVLAAYSGAVGYYELRTIEAYNVWYLLDRIDIFVRGLPAREARLDTRVVLGALTHRHLGLLAFAAATAVLARRAWRAAAGGGPGALPLLLALQFFAFFMLPTQMHQRYVLPAATAAALLAGSSPAAWALALLLGASAALNQGLDLARALVDHAALAGEIANPGRLRGWIRLAATAVALGNVALLGWALARGRRLLERR